MAVAGPVAPRFLQGQFPCDVGLELAHSSLGARCTPQGRMPSTFRLLRRSEDDFFLATRTDVLGAQLLDLSKYAAFFRKARLGDASQEWVRLGLWGEQARSALRGCDFGLPEQPDQASVSERGVVVRVPGTERFELWLPTGSAEAVIRELQQTLPPASLNDWQLQQIRAGLGEVSAATRESFIPQMLNLQLFNGVNFRKGCYTGQEIVARMQYLGKLKRRMFRLRLNDTQPLAAGTPIINRDNGQALGEVVMSAQAESQAEVLAVLQKDAAQLAALCAGDSKGPSLTLADLPYESELADSDANSANDKE